MDKEWSNKYGNISISKNVIGKIAAMAAMECYGLVGMASRNMQDGLAELLGTENLTKGLLVNIDENNVELELNIIVEYGTNIHEVANNIQDRVSYTVKDRVGIEVKKVDVIVQGVRVGNES